MRQFEIMVSEIKNYDSIKECSQIFDFLLDYEFIKFGSPIRRTNFTDKQIICLAQLLFTKQDEILRRVKNEKE